MIAVQSKAGFVIVVSDKNPPTTNIFRLTINTLAGRKIFPVNHSEITWIENWKKEAKAAQTASFKKNKRPIHFSGSDRAACMMVQDEWLHNGATQQSSAIIDFEGNQPRYDGYASSGFDSHRKYSDRGRNDKYKDRRLTAKGSGLTRV